MRITKLVFFVAFALPLAAQQPAPAPDAAGQATPSAAVQDTPQQRHASAVKFLQASDARQRLEQVLDKLLADGRNDLLQRNQGLDPRFADEWEKRMKLRVKADDFVNATAQVYEKYFSHDELDEMAQVQLGLKKGQMLTLSAELGRKLKAASPHIQRDINLQTSLIGARLGKEVGQEVERDHPEWGKNTGPADSAPPNE